MDLKEGYDLASEELKEFTKEQIAYYAGQGQTVDVVSHSDYCHKVYILGKLKQLEEKMDTLKGEENVTKETGKTRKAVSGKAKRKSNRQLDLGV